MATSRDTILKKLRAARQPIDSGELTGDRLPMVPLGDTSPDALYARFIEQAHRLGSVVHCPSTEAAAIDVILNLLSDDTAVLSWSFDHLPLPGLSEALAARHIAVADALDSSVRVGITGVDAALAATGSLVLAAGPGRHRVTSLLPPVHLAIVQRDQIVPDLESWFALRQASAVRQTSSWMVISGPSRTADIAMQMVMGMHGPAELHIVLLGEP